MDVLERPATQEPPLVVDLDGTLIATDLLVESAFHTLGRDPAVLPRMLGWLAQGRAQLKTELAARSERLATDTLPLDQAVLDFVRAERERGRRIVLATASEEQLARRIADRLGLFDEVIGTRDGVNLKGAAKARALVERYGSGGFDYIGNAAADLPIWREARQALVTGAGEGLVRRLREIHPGAIVLGRRRGTPGAYLRALRPHQWLKNGLIFVPMVAAHLVTLGNIATGLLAFMAFSLCASSVYLLNDLLDLEGDRAHPRKRNRPLASGALPVINGAVLVGVLFLLALGIALATSRGFTLVLLGYFALTLAYSVTLKRIAVTDVLTLGILYVLRIVAGAVAMEIPVSRWLLVFSLFLFLSLALIKRYAELVDLPNRGEGALGRRGYQADDLPLIVAMSGAAGYTSVLVLALYVGSAEVATLYREPAVIWLLCVLLIYWISRLLLLTHRGHMHDDPLVFALRDRESLGVGACGVAVLAVAAYGWPV